MIEKDRRPRVALSLSFAAHLAVKVLYIQTNQTTTDNAAFAGDAAGIHST